MSRCLLVFTALAVASQSGSAQSDRPFLVLSSTGHTGTIWDAVLVPGSEELITVSYDKTIRLWDLKSGQSLRTFHPPIGPGNKGRLIGAAISPDGKTLAVGALEITQERSAIYLISLVSGQIERTLFGHEAPTNAVAFSPNGKYLATCANDNTARLWDLASGNILKTMRHEHICVNSVAFAPDGQRLATASLDRTVRIWSVPDGTQERRLQHQGEMIWASFHPDSRQVATLGTDGLHFWNENGQIRRRVSLSEGLTYCRYVPGTNEVLVAGNPSVLVEGATGTVRKLSSGAAYGGNVTADGKRAILVTEEGEIQIWDIADATRTQTLRSRSNALWAAGWTADGALAFGDQGSRTTQRWNSKSALTRSFRLEDLQFGPAPASDSRRGSTFLNGRTLDRTDKRTLQLYENGASLKTMTSPHTIETGDGEIRAFSFVGPRRAAAADGNGSIHLFDLDTGRVLREFRGHTGAIWSLAPSPDGRYLVSASMDHTLRVWTLDRDEPLVSLFVAGEDWIAWTPEGYYAASAGGESLMGWQANQGPESMGKFYAASQFRASLYRPDVIKRLLTTGSVTAALAAADAERGKASAKVDVAAVLPPLVLITTPDEPIVKAAEPDVTLKGLARPSGIHPIRALKVLVNGRPVAEGVKTYNPPVLKEVRETWKLKLPPGKNTVTVVAESTVSKAISDPVEILVDATRGVARVEDKKQAQALDLPSLYVLAIGVSEYPGNLKLGYAAKDAQILAKTLESSSKSLYRKVEVKLLTDKDATRRNILQGLTWLRKEMTQRDVAIVSFAGHGDKDGDGKFYLLPVDVDVSDLLSTAVPGDQMKSVLGALPGRVIVLLDACHSGAVDGERRRSGGGLADDLVRDLVTEDYGVVVMCSAMGREFAIESVAVEHGFFTLALVEGITGKADYNRDGVVYLNELDLYVTNRVKDLSKGRQHPVTVRPGSLRSFPLAGKGGTVQESRSHGLRVWPQESARVIAAASATESRIPVDRESSRIFPRVTPRDVP